MITPANLTPPETPAGTKTETAAGPVATKQMFLQLLVSQIKNQNPLNPADPAEFLSQLTQFTAVEQMLEMRQQLEAIRELLEAGASRRADSNSSQENS
jgi:flagellar basal-body rod modification protein FlgD